MTLMTLQKVFKRGLVLVFWSFGLKGIGGEAHAGFRFEKHQGVYRDQGEGSPRNSTQTSLHGLDEEEGEASGFPLRIFEEKRQEVLNLLAQQQAALDASRRLLSRPQSAALQQCERFIHTLAWSRSFEEGVSHLKETPEAPSFFCPGMERHLVRVEQRAFLIQEKELQKKRKQIESLSSLLQQTLAFLEEGIPRSWRFQFLVETRDPGVYAPQDRFVAPGLGTPSEFQDTLEGWNAPFFVRLFIDPPRQEMGSFSVEAQQKDPLWSRYSSLWNEWNQFFRLIPRRILHLSADSDQEQVFNAQLLLETFSQDPNPFLPLVEKSMSHLLQRAHWEELQGKWQQGVASLCDSVKTILIDFREQVLLEQKQNGSP